ncbi:uncharacterized protein M6B38_124055 [Iris pallida]|uniref:PHD-type domain-containing protein n=1 Tax=Iris pallida TaxID=29817 RepID=A0AAX6H399_IRIPA|nr:uncharacterized protein M6B38_124055 [Iris pallida]
MHFNRTLLPMASKIDCGFSGSTCGIKEGDTCSSIDLDRTPTYKYKICDVSQPAASETSNLLGASSSCDSYSQNAESKAMHKLVATCDASEDVEMPLIVPSAETVEVDEFLQKKRHVSTNVISPSNSHTVSVLCQRSCSNQEDEQRGLEYNGDNLSCISGVRGSSISVGSHSLDKKDATYFSASSSCLLAGGIKSDIQIKEKGFLNGTDKESLEKNAGPADPALLDKYVDFTLPNIDTSPKVKLPDCHSPSLSCQNGVIEEGEVAVKIAEPCLTNENCTDNGILSDKLMKFNTISNESELPRSLVNALPNMQGIQEQPQSIMAGGNHESETELEDVKVCDICGDAGRENLLAICSRCSDGAEHTYCMREKLHKVPEGDWLCEECRLKEETKNKKERKLKEETPNNMEISETTSGTSKDFKHKDTKEKVDKCGTVFGISKECKVKRDTEKQMKGKSETLSGTLKQASLKETTHNSLGISSCKLPPNMDTKVILPDSRTPKGLQTRQPSFKRHADSQDSKRNGESSVEIGSLRKKIALSRESSFKDPGKAKIGNMLPSCGGQSSNGSLAFSCSQSLLRSSSSNVQGILKPPVGFLSRSMSSNSFIAKPKGIKLCENVPVKTKMTRESASMDTRKETFVRSLSKSTSFKSENLRSSTESASKSQFINQSRIEDPRGSKQVKERNVMEKSRIGNSLLRAGGASITVPKLDLKSGKNVTKLKNASESNILSINKGSDITYRLGGNEAKKHLTCSSKSSGGACFSAKGKVEDQRERRHPKEGPCGNFSAIDKLCSNREAISQRGTLQSAESAPCDDKAKAHNTFSSSRKVVSNGNRVLHCLRCNETGHATQFCSIDKIKLSALKPSVELNSSEGNKWGKKWKDAVEATITKSRIQTSGSQPDEPEEFPVSTADLSCDAPTDCQKTLRSSDANPSKTGKAKDLGQQPIQLAEVSTTPLLDDLNANIAVSDELSVKHVLHILPDQASILSNPFRTSAVPELDFIWQGSIEVPSSRRDPELFDGIQAHLSSCASPKVRDVVMKFPSTFQLEEVSRIRTWPWQFQGSSPKEENIALFLFAKDVESFERSYCKLLENMLKNDLALRGNIDGIELLIYPSNKLPMNSQRWNGLFYLWCVLKGRTDCTNTVPSSQKETSVAIINAEPLVQDLPFSLSSLVTPPKKAALVENTVNESPRYHKSPKSRTLNSSTCMDDPPLLSSQFYDKISNLQNSPLVYSSDHSVVGSVLPTGQISSSPVCHSLSDMNQLPDLPVTHPKPRFQTSNTQLCPEVKSGNTYLRDIGCDFEGKHVLCPSVHVTTNSEGLIFTRASPPNSSDYKQDMESWRTEKTLLEKDISFRSVAIFNDDPRGNQMEVDNLSGDLMPRRKRARSCPTDTASQASGETSRSTGDTMVWTDEINCLPFDDEREQKKMCYGEGYPSTDVREGTVCGELSSKVHPLLASFSNERHIKFLDGGSCEEKMIPENPRSEGRFFPVEPSSVKSAKADEVIEILSSDDEHSPEFSSQNRELGLKGKKKSQNPETLPLLFQPSEAKFCKENPQVSVEDDISLSLTLSLAAPASKVVKPIFKSEQLVPDTPHVNTSLFLSSGFTDT